MSSWPHKIAIVATAVAVSTALSTTEARATTPRQPAPPASVSADSVTAQAVTPSSRRPGNVSDFNGDGYADVLGVDTAGDMWFYPHVGNGLGTPAKIGTGWSNFRFIKAADWNSDGRADVIAIDNAGRVWLYPNVNGGLGVPQELSNGTVDWTTFRAMMAADWSCDGYSDVMGIDAVDVSTGANATMYYFPHQGDDLTPAQAITTGASIPSWSEFREVSAADWNGDRCADIIGVNSAGDLWYYPHNGPTVSTPTKLGSGWQGFPVIRAADWSGDSQADIIGVDAVGDLWYYPHQGNGLGARQRIGNGWGDFAFIL